MTIRYSSQDLLLENYYYHLPATSIAQRPLFPRHQARLLVYRQAEERIEHDRFLHLGDYLPVGSLLVTNNSKVLPCRLPARKETGGKAEILVLDGNRDRQGCHKCLIGATGEKREGMRFYLGQEGEMVATVERVEGDGTFSVYFDRQIAEVLEKSGRMPIPPYIRGGESDQRDTEDYQTLFASRSGSVAAPTAGLHFTPEVFDRLEQKGIERVNLSLQVGMGSFAPVKAATITDHSMHQETFSVEQKVWQKIKTASFRTLVGTTTLRAVESLKALGLAADDARWGTPLKTNLFIHPGKKVDLCDALITNFHQPRSTLLMLVSSLLGREKALEIYHQALAAGYRFLSYGDAMLILRERSK